MSNYINNLEKKDEQESIQIECVSPASVATIKCDTGGIDPQVNKLVQVSSDDHQMSLAGGGHVQGVPLPCELSHDACDVIYPLLQWTE